MAWMTLIASAIIAGPMALWMTGVGPAVMLVVNFTGLLLTIRLYAVAASLLDRGQSLGMLGLFSGLMGSLSGELMLHIASRANLATAFSAYASLGATLYRLDVVNRWWPFVFVLFSGLFYAGLALLVRHLVAFRRELLGLEQKTRP